MDDEEEPEVISDDEDGAGAPGEDDEEEDGEGEDDEGAEDTAKASGPAATAKKVKGSIVPKEDNLSEVEDEED